MRDTWAGIRYMLAVLMILIALVWVVAVDAATGTAPGCCMPVVRPAPMSVGGTP